MFFAETKSRSTINIVRPDQLSARHYRPPVATNVGNIRGTRKSHLLCGQVHFWSSPARGRAYTITVSRTRWSRPRRRVHRAMGRTSGNIEPRLKGGDFLHIPSWLPHQELKSFSNYPVSLGRSEKYTRADRRESF